MINLKTVVLVLIVLSLSSCAATNRALNPFYEGPTAEALKGSRNDHALGGENKKVDNARVALEKMASYRRAQDPQPANPVMQPAVVRIMWVPDHLNSHGDLVPAHYYYLKVLKERWAVQDAFELEKQLNGDQRNDNSNLPYILETDSKQ